MNKLSIRTQDIITTAGAIPIAEEADTKPSKSDAFIAGLADTKTVIKEARAASLRIPGQAESRQIEHKS